MSLDVWHKSAYSELSKPFESDSLSAVPLNRTSLLVFSLALYGMVTLLVFSLALYGMVTLYLNKPLFNPERLYMYMLPEFQTGKGPLKRSPAEPCITILREGGRRIYF